MRMCNEDVDMVTIDNSQKKFCCEEDRKNRAVPRKECGIEGGSFKIGNNIVIKSLLTIHM